jgi:hypothetical protein
VENKKWKNGLSCWSDLLAVHLPAAHLPAAQGFGRRETLAGESEASQGGRAFLPPHTEFLHSARDENLVGQGLSLITWQLAFP